MDIILQLQDAAEKSKSDKQYGVKNISTKMSKTDVKLNEIIDKYYTISKSEKIKIRKLMTAEIAWLLLCFSIRMATYSLRTADQRYFTNGLLALSMAYGILDEREILIVLVLYYDVQAKKGLSLKKTIEQNDDFALALVKFLRRNEEDKSLSCMGYTLLTDENKNLTYFRTW